jgi:hypothetical protein
MHELLYHYWCYPVMLMGGSHQINTSYIAAGAVLLLMFFLAVFAASHKPSTKPKPGGEIIVNRNDPTRDFIRWELMSWPDDWEDGDQLIFTVVEHKIVQSGPEVEVKK